LSGHGQLVDLAVRDGARTPSTGEPVRAVQRTLTQLCNDRTLRAAGSAPVVARVRSIAVRPFSYVAQIDVESSAGLRPLIAKIPRWLPPRADRRLQTLDKEFSAERVVKAAFAHETDLGVPEVIAFYRDVPVLVWARLDGLTLSQLMAQSAAGFPGERQLRMLEDACRGAGRWLRALQQATPVADSLLSKEKMLEYVNVRLERIGELRPGALDPDAQAAVRGVFQTATLPAADCRIAGVHGDYTLSNILCERGRTMAIDLARFGVGSIYYDVTRLYHQLGLLLHKPWYRPAVVARLRRALLAGYDPDLREDRTIFQLYLIHHLLCHWLGRLKPSAASSAVRGFHWWVGQRQRRELLALVARLQGGASPAAEDQGVA
jgi:aminoglycoside phosphotransferase